MVNYRLLALDLDGTTLNDDKKISETTRYWITRAVEAGVTVIFATGRGMQTAKHLWDELKLEAPMVLLNGAEIWKRPGRLWERSFISRKDIRKLYNLAVDYNAKFWGYSVESLTHQDNWTDDMFDRDWMKFGIRHDDLVTIEQLRDIVKSWGHLEVTRSAPVNMEVSCKGITKANGVRKVCCLLGIQMNQVMAIGDNHNDLHLIQNAGLGIAMGNADKTLLHAANKTTDTNNRDGVAKAIQQYLLNVS